MLPDELADALSNDEIGQYSRLMLRLLAQPAPHEHTLPTDAAVLSRWAGLATGDAVSSRVLAEFNTVDGRLRCARVDAVLCETKSRRQVLSEAGKRGAAKVWGDTRSHTPEPPTDKGGHVHPMARPRPPHGQAIEPAIPTPERGFAAASRAHAALERSNSNVNSSRSSAELPPEKAIAGAIFDGLEAAAAVRFDEFRRSKAIEILERTITRWIGEGRIEPRFRGGPMPNARTEAIKISHYPHATPAACEIAIQRCEHEHFDPDRGPVGNPIGFVISAVGAKRGGKPLVPWLSEVPIVDRWNQLERKVFDAARTKAAAEAAARRIDECFQKHTHNPAAEAKPSAATGA